jgi:hypothetical protein
MLESVFQSELIKDLEFIFPGCIVLKNDANYIQGFPDLTILYKNKWAVLECKKDANAAYQPNQDESGEYHFRIIAGERRWRAAAIAGLDEVPCVVKFNLTAEQEIRLAIIENLQRQDLDPIEEARAYKLLLEAKGYTQESLAKELGVSQGHIANRIRLLELPEEVQENISREIISHREPAVPYRNNP